MDQLGSMALIAMAMVLGISVLYVVKKRKRTSSLSESHIKQEYLALSGVSAMDLDTDKGNQGEYAIYKTLRQMNLGGYALVNLYVPYRGGISEIDVVYIHKTGIYVFESKNYSGKVYGIEKARNWSQYLGGQKYSFYNPIWQNKTHVNALASVLSIPKADMQSYIVFGDAATIQKVTVSADAPPVLVLADLAKRMQKNIKSRKIRYSTKEVTALANKVWNMYGLADEETKRAHIERIEARHGTA